ncbi:hypothetical protein SAMD00019534_009190 [Acytostelium subglobosum LB1]|uniref:hypothetical protein n=1 Tax=Acytostelium subglobosum LB1 TaxID=1410327 RepID=UPI000644A292|nr:hypothetical protein SAMD00019534_009190 [Acytostelium subglobosum LB1]GAM17744.1 hypothetical protein SAMD00019534_009190 [Acytostelium subglobosum LB1]|eukprot:XP_012758340.1 hypothetical protein SAMD00019534_009190 [Acytostelium subglobosum LB1]
MNIVVGSDNGLIKICNLQTKQVVSSFGSITSSIQNELQTMSFGWDNNETQMLQGFKGGAFKHWQLQEDGTGHVVSECTYDSAIRAIRPLSEQRLLIATEKGTINVVKVSEDGVDMKQLDTLSFSKSLFALKVNPSDESKVVIGGKECDLAICDINTKQLTWRAKNAPPDKLRVSPPIWITDMEYTPTDHNRIVTGTGHYQIRLYDCRKNRTPPILDLTVTKHPILSIKMSSQFENSVFASDSVGNVFAYDLRNG